MTLTRQLRVELILETIIYLDPFASMEWTFRIHKNCIIQKIHTGIEPNNRIALKRDKISSIFNNEFKQFNVRQTVIAAMINWSDVQVYHF